MERTYGAMVPSVLFMVFNRPALTAQVMEAIRAARPGRLYVAADGPREGREDEATLCAEARRIATNVDWPCDVRTLFRGANLGCRAGVSGAIDWFFEHENEGIILEDDCVPSQSFFSYCAELLARYRHDSRVMCISGDNPTTSIPGREESYFFSRYPLIWGWATWRRAWRLYDGRMFNWPAFRDSGQLEALSDDKSFRRHWISIFNRVAAGTIDTWDYQWTFSCWFNSGLACVPNHNLVKNIGFGPAATHTRDVDNARSELPTNELEWPLIHPDTVERDSAIDFALRMILFEPEPRQLTWLERARFRLGLRTWLKGTLARLAH